MSLFTDVGQQDTQADALRTPSPGPATTPWEAASADLDAWIRTRSGSAQTLNQYDFIQQKMDEYQQKTGEKLENNPGLLDQNDPAESGGYFKRTQELRDQFAAKSKELNDPSLVFPSDDEITQGGVDIARKSMSRQDLLAQGAQGFGTSIARFGAGVLEQTSSVPNAIALGVMPEAALPMRILQTAGAFGGATALDDLLGYRYSKMVDPSFGLGTIARETGEAALGGAAFEAGGAAVKWAGGALWRRLKSVLPETAAKTPQPIADAGEASARQGDLWANNPYHGMLADGAHADAVAKIESDMAAGRAPELPPSATDPASFAGPTAEDVDKSARLMRPDVFSETDRLEAAIAAKRAEVGEAAKSPFDKDIPVERRARMELNDLQQQRAALGPSVNEARQQASSFLQSHPPAPEPPVAPAVEAHPATAAEAFGDKATIDAAANHPFKSINRMADAMENAAPEWNAMRAAAKSGAIPAGQDVTNGLMEAVGALVRAHDEGKTIAETMNAGPVFHSDVGQLATRLFFDHDTGKFLSKAEMTANLKSLAKGLKDGPEIEKAPRAAAPVEPGVASAMRDAAQPDAVAKAQTDSNINAAITADLNRNIEQGRNRVPLDDGTLGFADKELADINAMHAASDEIRACAGGPAVVEAGE